MKNDFHIYEQVARGKQSVVYKARRKKKLDFVAIKRVDKSRREKVMNESKILKLLQHPNILRFQEYNETKNHLWVITEYCPGGDLLHLLQQDHCLAEPIVKTFAQQICQGLLYVHSQGVLIGDLKPACVLLNEYGTVKLSGFGSAMLVNELTAQDAMRKKGTPSYMAPQLFEVNGVYSYASDLWALGCLLHELATGTPPFLSPSIKEIIRLVRTGQTPQVPNFSIEFNQLLLRLLAKRPEQRITWKQFSSNPWLHLEIPFSPIPNQVAYENYIRKKTKEKKQPQLLRTSQQFQGYGAKQILATDRRQQFIFESDTVGPNAALDSPQNEENSIYGEQVIEVKAKTVQMKQRGTREPKAEQMEESMNVVSGIMDQLSNKSLPSWQDVLQHQSDTAVKPIIGNKDIQISQKTTFNKRGLGFQYIDPEIMAEGVLRGEMKEELKKVLDGMGGEDKQQVLCYFESIIHNSDIANYLFKSSFVPYYLRFIKNYKQAAHRAKMCEVLGLLIRHATSIDPDILRQGIVNGLLEAIKDKNEKVRRKAMAALGELLFYGATQVDQKVTEWDISVSLIHNLLKILKNANEDEIVRFYCCKSIENITAQARQVGLKFSQVDTLVSLIGCFTSTPNQAFRSSVAACLHHIIILNQALREVCIEKLGTPSFIAIFRGSDTSSKTHQIMLWLLIEQFGHSPKGKLSRSILNEESLFQSILAILESTTPIVRGRIYIYIYFTLLNDLRFIGNLLNSQLFMFIVRSNRDTHKYESKCLQFVLLFIYQNYRLILKLAKDEFIKTNAEKKSEGRKNSYMGFIAKIVEIPIFDQIFQTFENISELIKLFQVAEEGSHGELIRSQLTTSLEIIISKKALAQKLQEQFTRSLIPFLIGKIIKSVHNDVRFCAMNCLKLLMKFYLGEEAVYASGVFSQTTSRVTSLVAEHLVPNLSFLVAQQPPVPAMTISLIANLFETSPIFVKSFHQHCGCSILLPFLKESVSLSVLKAFQIYVSRKLLSLEETEKILPSMLVLLGSYSGAEQLERFLEYPLQILRYLIENCSEEQLNFAWSLIVPLQSHEDSVIRAKAVAFIRRCLDLKRFASKVEWTVSNQQAQENYSLLQKIINVKQFAKQTD